MLSICAVIAARNEAQYLQVLLPILAGQAIDVVIIDNESIDDSQKLYSAFRGRPIINLEHLPYRGYFSLSEQLEAKKNVYQAIRHDWVIHLDADEVLEHAKAGLSLRDAIQEADDSGCTIVNFDQFVFLPEMNSNYQNRNYYTEMLRYYFFEPEQYYLQRAWKRIRDLSNISSGGHRLSGSNLSIYPINHILRHYIVLSNEHAQRKYLQRTFSEDDLRRGWHGNRRNFTEANLVIPGTSRFLFRLNRYDSKEFCKDAPASRHYWDWSSEG